MTPACFCNVMANPVCARNYKRPSLRVVQQLKNETVRAWIFILFSLIAQPAHPAHTAHPAQPATFSLFHSSPSSPPINPTPNSPSPSPPTNPNISSSKNPPQNSRSLTANFRDANISCAAPFTCPCAFRAEGQTSAMVLRAPVYRRICCLISSLLSAPPNPAQRDKSTIAPSVTTQVKKCVCEVRGTGRAMSDAMSEAAWTTFAA